MRHTLLLINMITLVLFSCQDKEPVTIGFVGDLTGPVSDLGSHSRNGMLLAVEDWNSRGGVKGQPIELIIRDDQQNPERLSKHLDEMIEKQVAFVVGPTSSSMASLATPIATEHQLLLLGTSVSTDLLSGQDDYFFRIMPTTKSTGVSLMDYLIKHVEFKNFSTIIDTSNQIYTKTWMSSVIKRAESAGKVNQYFAEYSSGDKLSLLNATQQIAFVKNDLILFCSNPVDAALLIRQIRSIDRNVVIVACEWSVAANMLQLSGEDADGLYYSTFALKQPHSQAYKDLQIRYADRFQDPITSASLVSYVITNAGLHALHNKQNNQTLKEYLLLHPKVNTNIDDFRFDEYGDLATNILSFVGQIQNQQFVILHE